MDQTFAVNRFILPIHDPQHVGTTTYDAKDPDTSFPPIREVRPPAGAPNVLIVLLDDIGFGASSAFGGAINTPTADRLAAGGVKLSRFHTTALCAPSRAALLTGRNHHSVGMGAIPEVATSAPGYTSIRPKSTAPLAEILKLNGYSTAQFGKCHEVPVWKTSPVGPFDLWPTGSGFDYFYGFIGGETNQFYPALYEGTTPVEPPSTPAEGYHLTDDMTDRASPGSVNSARCRPISRSSPTSPRAQPMLRTTSPASGRTSTRVDSTPAGTRCELRSSLVRRSSVSFPPTPNSPLDRRHPSVGGRARDLEAGACPADGGLCRILGAHRPRRGPGHRSPR